jgi:hypothetical protein
MTVVSYRSGSLAGSEAFEVGAECRCMAACGTCIEPMQAFPGVDAIEAIAMRDWITVAIVRMYQFKRIDVQSLQHLTHPAGLPFNVAGAHRVHVRLPSFYFCTWLICRRQAAAYATAS